MSSVDDYCLFVIEPLYNTPGNFLVLLFFLFLTAETQSLWKDTRALCLVVPPNVLGSSREHASSLPFHDHDDRMTN